MRSDGPGTYDRMDGVASAVGDRDPVDLPNGIGGVCHCRAARLPISPEGSAVDADVCALGGADDDQREEVTTVPRALIGFAALLLIAAAPSENGRVRFVIDGDTFTLTSGERIRIAGIDAPETQSGQAKCQREIAAGHAATRRTKALIEGRRVVIERLGRSYRRTVARVRLDGRDLAGELVATGIARWWPRGKPRPDWCANPKR